MLILLSSSGYIQGQNARVFYRAGDSQELVSHINDAGTREKRRGRARGRRRSLCAIASARRRARGVRGGVGLVVTDAIDSAAVHAARALAGTPCFAMPGAFALAHAKMSVRDADIHPGSCQPRLPGQRFQYTATQRSLEPWSPEAALVRPCTGSISPGLDHGAATRDRSEVSAHRQFVHAWRMRRMVLTIGGCRERASDRSQADASAAGSDIVLPHASGSSGEDMQPSPGSWGAMQATAEDAEDADADAAREGAAAGTCWCCWC